MIRFSGQKELFQYLDDIGEAAMPQRRQLAWSIGVSQCYVEGLQWISDQYGSSEFPKTASAGRQRSNTDLDMGPLRVTDNITAKAVQKIAAHTNPDEIRMDVFPEDLDTGTSAFFGAQVHEAMLNIGVDYCGIVRAAQVANFRRCIAGCWGMGLALQSGNRMVRGQLVPDTRMRAIQFNPANLVLDPACQEPDLDRHDAVTYTDTWTVEAIERTFGIKFSPDEIEKMATIAELEPNDRKLSTLSDARLFSKFARYSKTKGARIYQTHVVDESGRFGKWYVVIETTEGKRLVNDSDDRSPFAGSGMPFQLLHAHWRSDTIWSWGEPAQMKDSQDKKNLAESIFWRIAHMQSGFQWVIDERAFGNKPNRDDINKELTNRVGGIIRVNMRGKGENVMPPTLVQPPAPPPFLREVIESYGLEAKDKIHTSEGLYGKTPTHVPASSFQRAQDDAGQVISVRVSNDIRAYEYIVGVMHATNVRLVQDKNPGTIACLSQKGFGAQEFAALLESDPYDLPIRFRIREGSIRTRSHEYKKQNLDFALTSGAMTPFQYQRAMSEELDSSLTSDMRQMAMEARKASLAIIAGEDWIPTPLGQWNDLFIEEFTKAQFDKKAKPDISARQRLVAAIQSQQMMRYQEQLLANPELAMQAQQQPQAEPGAEEAPAPQEGQAASVADVLDALSRGGSGAGAPVPATAA